MIKFFNTLKNYYIFLKSKTEFARGRSICYIRSNNAKIQSKRNLQAQYVLFRVMYVPAG